MAASMEELVLTFQRERVRFAGVDAPLDEPSACIVECTRNITDNVLANIIGPVVVKVESVPNELVTGLSYRFYGHWTNHERFGRQFAAKTFCKVQPLHRAGVIRYLMQAPHVGQKTATTLWDKFGDGAVQMLREQPEVAAAAAGRALSEPKALEAAAYLRRESAIEATTIELMELLTGRGFPKNTARRAVAEWGNLAPTVIRRSPYSLMRFRGCGFLRCDQMFLDLGGNPARLKRQALAAWYAIARDSNGNTWHSPQMVERGISERVAGADVRAVDAIRLAIRAKALGRHRDAAGALWLAENTKAKNERDVAERVRLWATEDCVHEIQYSAIQGFDGYRVGTDGSVWSMRSNNGGIADDWKLLKHDACNGGYLRVTMRNSDGEFERRQVSHLVLSTFVGDCPEGFVACHGDGNPTNNCLINLRWDTRSNNEADKRMHGTAQVGEGNPAAKLTNEQVVEIRKTYAETESSLNELAEKFGVSKRTILDVVKHKHWKHII